MKHHKPFYVTITLGVLLCIALLATQYMRREDSTITLPMPTTETETSDKDSHAETLNILSITPNTVQAAVATLSRPASYQRTQTVTLYWDGGESSTTAQVAVNGTLTRIDTTHRDGTVCHTLSDTTTTCVWYDDDTHWVATRTALISADALQRMPTYESVLELDSTQITHAEYGLKDSVYCIYIQTAPDLDGYAEQYWVSAQSGLLYAAERTYHGQVIYRFQATEPEHDTPEADLFLLPDATPFPSQ